MFNDFGKNKKKRRRNILVGTAVAAFVGGGIYTMLANKKKAAKTPEEKAELAKVEVAAKKSEAIPVSEKKKLETRYGKTLMPELVSKFGPEIAKAAFPAIAKEQETGTPIKQQDGGMFGMSWTMIGLIGAAGLGAVFFLLPKKSEG